ncbi:FAD-dependent oxidoreductase [Legionella sp. W05-934-2]|uniref:FAD-dependent oxidoreductase n=1 Tax=Legionella sp. W05-934-2 TaxID=1198649 RepID=UPI003462F5C5
MQSVTIIGGGLAGCLMSLYLAQRGYDVIIFESRGDLRLTPHDYGRSINMALSCRGITALNSLNLLTEIKPIMVPMRARAIYEQDGSMTYQPFGRTADEYINSIKRTDLNRMLLDCIDANQHITVYFDHTLSSIDFDKKLCLLNHHNHVIEHHYDHLIGADGAPSIVRESLTQAGIAKATREFLQHGYKELTIAGPGDKRFVREHLHIWPQDQFMLLGNPNPDHSITGSLFLAVEGKQSFATIQTESQIHQFFRQNFKTIYPHMPSLVDEFQSHPVGYLSTIKCAPWFYQDQCLLIGDAAHGIVPFFGQGMNAAFEDCRILNDLLHQHNDNWSKVLPAFYKQRKENTDAVAAMSMDNYDEIRHDVLDDQFVLRKALEHELMRRYPEHYLSRHVMVMFTNLPYKVAHEQAKKQLDLIERLCVGKFSIEEVDWQKVDNLIKENVLNTYQLIDAYQTSHRQEKHYNYKSS